MLLLVGKQLSVTSLVSSSSLLPSQPYCLDCYCSPIMEGRTRGFEFLSQSSGQESRGNKDQDTTVVGSGFNNFLNTFHLLVIEQFGLNMHHGGRVPLIPRAPSMWVVASTSALHPHFKTTHTFSPYPGTQWRSVLLRDLEFPEVS